MGFHWIGLLGWILDSRVLGPWTLSALGGGLASGWTNHRPQYWPDAPLLGCEWPARSDASLELGDVFSGNLGMLDPLASGKSAGGGGGGG